MGAETGRVVVCWGRTAVAPIHGDCAKRLANDLEDQGATTSTEEVRGALFAHRGEGDRSHRGRGHTKRRRAPPDHGPPPRGDHPSHILRICVSCPKDIVKAQGTLKISFMLTQNFRVALFFEVSNI